jgi:DNA polymerase-1
MDRLPEMEKPRYEVLSSLKQVREMLKAIERAQLVALDVQAEGTGAVGATLIGVSLCFGPGHVYYAPLGPEGTDSDAILRELRPLLGVTSAPKVMHDSKRGLVVLA